MVMSANSATQFKMVILSPTKTLFEGNVHMAVIPGTEGNLGVLPNHAPLIISLKPGQVKIYRESSQKLDEEITIPSGYANIQENLCQLFVNEA